MSSKETQLNILFHSLLIDSSEVDLKQLLINCFGIPSSDVERAAHSPKLEAFLTITDGKEIDELITFGSDLGIAVELKDKWKTSPGQLENYFEFVSQRTRNSFLVFLSQSPDDIRHPTLARLFQNQRWRHRTWRSVSDWLQTIESFKSRSAKFREFLSAQRLNIERARNIKEYGLDASLSGSSAISLNDMTLARFKNNKPLTVWNNREEFWIDVTTNIRDQLQLSDFFSYRRDIYHYMWRWAFFERNVFFDMTDDNKWEYYIDYYEANIKGQTNSAHFVKMRKWYDYFLKIGKNQYIDLGNAVVGVISVNGKDCYFASEKSSSRIDLRLVKLWKEIPW